MSEQRPDTEEGAANLALGHIKQPPIALLTDNNDRARAVKAMFGAARDAVLRMQWWNFATGWTSPAATAGFVHPSVLKTAYKLPDDCLKVRFVDDAAGEAWEVVAAAADPAGSTAEVSVLLTNKSAPLICYTRRIETVRLWDADFLLAFSYLLASMAGPQLGASATRVKELRAAAEEWEDDAAEEDAREKSVSQVSRTTSWITSRRRGGSISRG